MWAQVAHPPPVAPSTPNATAASLLVAGAGATAAAALVVDAGSDAAAVAAAVAAGLGMPRVPGASMGAYLFTAPPPLPPISHLHAAGPDSALDAALVTARAAAAEGQGRVRVAALAWERERDAVDALAHQIAEAEQLLVLPASHVVGATSSGSIGHRVSHTAVI